MSIILLCFVFGTLADDPIIVVREFISRSEAIAHVRWGECLEPTKGVTYL